MLRSDELLLSTVLVCAGAGSLLRVGPQFAAGRLVTQTSFGNCACCKAIPSELCAVPLNLLCFPRDSLPASQIRRAGFKSPTPIQGQAWPIALSGRDLVAIAKTGSGKTCGFLLPGMLHIQQTRKDPRAGPTLLVLAPTRELAVQIKTEADKFGRSSGIRNTCVYGGAPKGPQLRDIQYGVQIVIATPGRLNDFLEAGQVRLQQVRVPALPGRTGCASSGTG